MTFPATVVRVLIASLGDTGQARLLLRDVLQEWNSLHAEDSSVMLLPVMWERDATPEMGDRPQGIINRQLVDASDILVGIYPLTVAGAHGRNQPAELAASAALTQKWPALTSLVGTPAYNVGRAYAAFAADIDNGTHTVPDFADAVRRHQVIDAIERSAASGERVKA